MSNDNGIRKGRWISFALTLFFLGSLAWLMLQATPAAHGADATPATYPAWWQQVKSANKKSLNALWGDNTQGFFAVGDEGLILHTTRPAMDNSWLVMPSNTTARLLTIWGTDKNHLFAGGANGTILSYNGSAWSQMTITPTIHILDLWGVSPTDLYAVGFQRLPPPFFVSTGMVLHYDGQSWQVIHRDVANDYLQIWGSSPTDMFVTATRSVSGNGPLGQIMHYDGTQWTATPLPDLSPFQTFKDIWGSAANDVYAVVSCASGTTALPCVERSRPLLYHFDGQSWGIVPEVTELLRAYALAADGTTPTIYSGANAIWGNSQGNRFLLGSRGLILHYDGQQWQPLPNGFGATNLYAISGDSQGLVAVGQDGLILRYADSNPSCATVTQIPRAECDALVDLYLRTNARLNNDGKNNWLQNNTPCGANPRNPVDPAQWRAVLCPLGRVVAIGLYPQQSGGNSPSGVLPASLTQLQELRELIVNDLVTGPFPTWLDQLPHLTNLTLRSNIFQGSLPATVGNLTELVELELLSANSNLTGPLPATLGNLKQLKKLGLGSNFKLYGPLPLTLSQLTQLESFTFLGTSLCIPDNAALQSWLGQIKSMTGPNVPCAATHTVRGVIRNRQGQPLAGVEVAAVAGNGAQRWYGAGVTGADGSYAIPYLRAGSYTVLPSRDSATFTPVTSTVTVAGDVGGQDFVGIAPLVGFQNGELVGQPLQPGSKLILTLVDFPTAGQARITVNGRLLGTMTMDNNGQAAFLLDTSGASTGAYLLSVAVAEATARDHHQADSNPTATLALRLVADGTLVTESDATLPQVQIPPDIAYQLNHLPLIRR